MADWDTYSRDFDRIFLEWPMYLPELEKMVSLAPDVADQAFCDLGCGTGNLVSVILERFPEARVTGVDPSAGMREVLASRFEGNPRVTAVEGHALSIPSPDASFDCVFSNLALHHVAPDERDACASEIARVLKSGGRLVYGDMFCGVDAPPDDPERCRDIIERVVGVALYCLDHGAYDMMCSMFATLGNDLRDQGEHLTTEARWVGTLESAGFTGAEVIHIEPARFGLSIVTADKS